jgi:hypothetical protein
VFTAVQDFLLRLTPLRAFMLFSACLVAGSSLIFIEWGKPVTPSLPVIAYGSVLFYCQTRLYVQFNGTTKDSPYFLGFLLTLVALLQILSANLSESLGREFMTREVGAAVLTTVCGLFMRQLLLSRDPGEEAQDRIFQTLADEIRKDAVEFHRTQKLFVDLVREFVQTREDLFVREEKAFAQYVERLREGATVLGKIQLQFPKLGEDLINSLEAGATKIKAIWSDQETTFGNIAKSYTEEFEREKRMLSQHTEEIGRLAASYPQAGAVLTRSARELYDAVLQARQGVAGFSGDIAQISTDVKAIDKIVDDVVRLLRERLNALSAHP